MAGSLVGGLPGWIPAFMSQVVGEACDVEREVELFVVGEVGASTGLQEVADALGAGPRVGVGLAKVHIGKGRSPVGDAEGQSESSPRARSNNEGPINAPPGARLMDGLTRTKMRRRRRAT